MQASHSEDRLWQACAIYCETEKGGWYTPRLEVTGVMVSSCNNILLSSMMTGSSQIWEFQSIVDSPKLAPIHI